ncbi:hypothetical protein RRG08_051568 [Elysia crispata]|uniref:Chitin-binding type-2 domain-containing protein n=1 Tax=Elysia crispata TaxID=231223 RepID=A0AAE1DH01_9GAST|nr:hypothetical protein RRG08_051568 [Elysia crispata]
MTVSSFFLALFLIISAEANTAPHEIDCKGAPDGLFEIGCWGYANCVKEVPEIHACPSGTVLERHNLKCIVPGTGQTDCFAPVTCVGKGDASYPDYGDKCVTYYRCQGQLLLGRFYCPSPTAFNEDLGICDYTRNLRQPCGPLPALKTTTTAPASSPSTTTSTTTTTTTAATKQTATTKVTVLMTTSSTASTSGLPTTPGFKSTPAISGGGPIIG